MLWSALRYVTTANPPNKPDVDAHPWVWTADGKDLNLYEKSQEPWNANAIKRRRETNAMRPEHPTDSGKKAKVGERFGKPDLTALVVAERLQTPAQVMAYAQDHGSAQMHSWLQKQQRHLKSYIQEAYEWDSAKSIATEELENDWALIERLALQTCDCGHDGCQWWAAAEMFFENNKPCEGSLGVDRRLLANCLRRVIEHGPSKVVRVPMIVGPSNAAKSTLLDPVRAAFGTHAVFNKPKIGASSPLSKLVKGLKRFIYFDDYRPVDFARLPRENATLGVSTFLAMFQGQPFDVQVSQSFNDGHPEVTWKRGAALTAPLDGVWEPRGDVSYEDIRHMKSRVQQFEAHHVQPMEQLVKVPSCAASWARWLIVDSVAFAHRANSVARPLLPKRRLPTLPIVDDVVEESA